MKILILFGIGNAVMSMVIVLVVVLFPTMALSALGNSVLGIFGLDKGQAKEIRAEIPDEAKEAMEKYRGDLEQVLDCSNRPVDERRPGENCVEGLIGQNDASWSPIPDSANWLVPVWQSAGKRYNVPWQVLAAINGARTSFGARMCSANEYGGGQIGGGFLTEGIPVQRGGEKGFYRTPVRLWDINNTDGGSAKTTSGDSTFCERSEPPAKVFPDMKKPLKRKTQMKSEPDHGDPYDAVDATFTQAKILARSGAWKKKDWDGYTGSGPGKCTITPRAGQISYPPSPPSSFGAGGRFGFNKKLKIPNWAKALAVKYRHPNGRGKYKPRRDPDNNYSPMPKGDIVKLLTVAWKAFGARGAELRNNVTLNYSQVGRESGGRAYILQGYIGDVNDNNPAGGLMQFIPGTFDHWNVDGFNDRFNPLDNILATVNAQVNGPYPILDGSSGWSPPFSENPYATGGNSKVVNGPVKASGDLEPQPYKGKKQKDAVSEAVRLSGDGDVDDCYVAVIHEWYRLIKKHPPDGVMVGGMPQGMKKLFGPKKFVPVPQKYQACTSCTVDARILPNLVYLLKKYKMVVTQGRNSYPPSRTHGDGTGVDIVAGPSDPGWKGVDAAAKAVGYRSGCAGTGGSPGAGCPLMPAFIWVGYDGVSGHGKFNHLHLSWANACYGCGGGSLQPPREWVMVFGTSNVSPLSAGGKQKWDGKTLRAKVSYFSDGITASGISAASNPGLALNLKPGTYRGWDNPTTDRWMISAGKGRPYCALVKIKGKQAVLPIIDKGPHEMTDRGIDISIEGIQKMGFNTSNFQTDAIGTAKILGKKRGVKCR
jgi:hypothetical protein